MSIPGEWTLHFDWDCNGSYNSTDINFNSNGTFQSGRYTGTWYQVEGMIIWSFDDSPVCYAGNIAGSAISGLMSTFEKSEKTGCWYAVRDDIRQRQARVVPDLDATGQQPR